MAQVQPPPPWFHARGSLWGVVKPAQSEERNRPLLLCGVGTGPGYSQGYYLHKRLVFPPMAYPLPSPLDPAIALADIASLSRAQFPVGISAVALTDTLGHARNSTLCSAVVFLACY